MLFNIVLKLKHLCHLLPLVCAPIYSIINIKNLFNKLFDKGFCLERTMALIKKFKKSKLALACALSFASQFTIADSEILGKVTDTSNKTYFEGASVKIKELNLTQVTKRDGSFRFKKLPEGTYTIEVSYLGASVEEFEVVVSKDQTITRNFKIGVNNELEEIIVFGATASQASALNRQKNSENLKTIVSSDAVGEFPDQNIAESLQRLPGMFIQRDQGEGRFVGIRGIDPNLNNLTINGANIPSPESGVRSVALDVIPSELIEGLEVSKTTTPDMDADAIGGSIEVKSLSAFDREDQSYSVKVQTSYNELTSEQSPKISGSFTDTFELQNGRLGVAAAASWYEREFGSHNIETDGGFNELELEDINTGDDIEQFGAEEIEQRSYRITRERTGLAFNLDYHTNSQSKYYLRTLYSKFSDDEYRLRNEYKFDKGVVDPSEWSDTQLTVTDAEMDRDTKDRFEEQTITSLVLGGENQGDLWDISYSLGYSKSDESEPNRIDASFAGEGLTLGYIANGEIPTLTQSANAHDPNNFELDEIEVNNNLTEDEETSFKIDFIRDFVWNDSNGQFKFGTKLRRREKFNDVNVEIYDGGFNDATLASFATSSPDWPLGNFGPGISRDGIRNYFRNNQGSLELNQLDSTLDSQSQTYNSSEDVNAAYAMVKLDVNAWQIVGGVRFESTSFSTSGNRAELIVDDINDLETVDTSVWNVDKDYDHVLPSLNLRYQVSDKLLTRFAVSQSLARPSFGDSAAFQLIETETFDDDGEVVTERKAEVGNPNLDPFESTNFDFSIEYYPGGVGVLSAGIFTKSIDNFIVLAQVEDNGLWDGFEEVIQPINGGKADINGVELAWVKNFNSGIHLSANATFTDADDELPNQSDTVANIVIGYENDIISTRLSFSHKSEAFLFDDDDIGVYEDTHSQIDFSSKFYFDKNSFVYFNGVNLTDEPLNIYHGSTLYNYQYEEYGRSYELGVTWRSF